MRDFICVPFGEDLISAALREIVDPAVLVFPTRVSAAQARTRFQNHWQFEDVEFITMDDLKSSSILPPQPSLADEKRLLCLWQVLDDEDRAQFHLTQYDDIVEWGGSFFRFFDELCDECVDAETLGALDSSGTMYLQAWQALYIDRVLQIRARYLAMIGSLGFTDPIFYVSEKNIRLNRKPARYIFVNQFYYSELEKRMISVLEESGNRIYVIWQGLEDSFDQGSLKMKSPILEDLQDGDFRVEKIEIIKTENEDQMVLAFLEAHAVELSQSLDEKDKKLSARLILDRQFCAKPYRELFARKVFAYPQAVSFSQSDLWQMLQLWQTHLEALAQSREQRYLPLRLVLQACSRELFVRFYQPDWGIVQRDALLREIKSLSRDDYLYLDKDLELFDLLSAEKQYPLLQSVMKSHFALLKQLGGIKNITGLCHVIDLSGALEIKAMCSPNELLYSDIREQFYERLANFCSIEHLGIVSDWRAIYADSGIALSARILKLFIEYLKSARYRFQKSGGAETLYEIGNLLDSRDLRYDEVIFFHTVEGEIPSNPGPVWLLNETQRAKLGLKSFTQIRDWERYYFFRLILCAKQARIYCYRNQDNDIEPGSFVSELILLHEHGRLSGFELNQVESTHPVSALYEGKLLAATPKRQIPGLEDKDICGFESGDAFFGMPCEAEKDFPKGEIRTSYYNLSQMTKNPFAWYINGLRRLENYDLALKETIGPKLFGTIMHAYLSELLRPLGGWHEGIAALEKAFSDTDKLTKILLELLSGHQYRYKIPQNYNHEFLTGIISECLVTSVRLFYQEFLLPKLKNRHFELIPEQDRMSDEEKVHKELVSAEYPDGEIRLLIRGKADLRIETGQQNIIVDFKTGGEDEGQLAFYEYFYYLLDPEGDEAMPVSLFWQILDQQRGKKSTDENKRVRWREQVQARLEDILQNGYRLPIKVADRKTLAAISRADLFNNSFRRDNVGF